jgi:hypothetical protein
VPISASPCTWPDLTQLCCSDWNTFDPAIQSQATEYAKTILWAATGRQFGLCSLTVRPCGRQCANCPAGYAWDGYGGWVPYVFAGQWRNCWCGTGPGCNNCDPQCLVYLPGPVNSVTQVKLGGVSLPASGSAYFVLDQQWLVRVDTTACWPTCGTQDLAPGDVNAFEVTYLRGRSVPTVLAQAMASLACEFAKACVGSPCRLPSRVTSISRQGVTISMVDVETILKNGLTGLWEVDQVIMSLNPTGMKGRTRFYSPDLQEPRQITWP